MKAIEELIALAENEVGLNGNCRDGPDDESVGCDGEARPLPMTFGHVRRARAELDAFSAGGTSPAMTALDARRYTLIRFGRNPDVLADHIARLEKALFGTLEYERGSAKVQGLSDCTCINRSRDFERLYETGLCPHQIARELLGDGQ